MKYVSNNRNNANDQVYFPRDKIETQLEKQYRPAMSYKAATRHTLF